MYFFFFGRDSPALQLSLVALAIVWTLRNVICFYLGRFARSDGGHLFAKSDAFLVSCNQAIRSKSHGIFCFTSTGIATHARCANDATVSLF